MSLGDYLRMLRARKGGITPWEIESAIPIEKGLYRQMEQRYRAVGDEESLRILAGFFDVPLEGMRWRLEWPRKALSRSLAAARAQKSVVTLELWDGRSLMGNVRWWDLGAVGLETADVGLIVVMRHAVERWSPRVENGRADEPVLDWPSSTGPGGQDED